MALELGQVTARRPPFKYSALARVGFSDTDAQGVVYYGRYLPYCDLARVEYHRHLGLLRPRPGTSESVMRATQIEYFAPARFDDLLEVFVRISRIGRTSVTHECAAYLVADDTLLVQTRQTLVFIDRESRRPVEVPAPYRDAIGAFEGADLGA